MYLLQKKLRKCCNRKKYTEPTIMKNGEKSILVCHMISQDNVINVLCDFMSVKNFMNLVVAGRLHGKRFFLQIL